MHINYSPKNPEYCLKLYQASLNPQQYQLGGDLQGFRAFAPYHRGGGLGIICKSLFRYAMPFLKSAGKHALITGSKVVADVSQGGTLNDSVKEHIKAGASGFLHETADNIDKSQSRKGRRGRRRRKSTATYKRRRQRTRSSSKSKNRVD